MVNGLCCLACARMQVALVRQGKCKSTNLVWGVGLVAVSVNVAALPDCGSQQVGPFVLAELGHVVDVVAKVEVQAHKVCHEDAARESVDERPDVGACSPRHVRVLVRAYCAASASRRTSC